MFVVRVPLRAHTFKFATKCSVCSEEYKEDEVLVWAPCGHIHHHKCAKDWHQHAQHTLCTLCRANFVPPAPRALVTRGAKRSRRDSE